MIEAAHRKQLQRTSFLDVWLEANPDSPGHTFDPSTRLEANSLLKTLGPQGVRLATAKPQPEQNLRPGYSSSQAFASLGSEPQKKRCSISVNIDIMLQSSDQMGFQHVSQELGRAPSGHRRRWPSGATAPGPHLRPLQRCVRRLALPRPTGLHPKLRRRQPLSVRAQHGA